MIGSIYRTAFGFTVLVAALIWGEHFAVADDMLVYQSAPGSEVSVDGTNHVGARWAFLGTNLDGTMVLQLAGADVVQAGKDENFAAKIQVSIPVGSLRSLLKSYGRVAEGIGQSLLRQDRYPVITFCSSQIKLKARDVAGKRFEIDAKGDLQMAGVTNSVAIPMTIECIGSNTVALVGSTQLKMTDFKMSPPDIMPAPIADEINISFKWLLQRPSSVSQ